MHCLHRNVACALPVLVLAVMVRAEPPISYRVSGDEIVESLTGQAGAAERGRALAIGREDGGCVLCHALPGIDGQFSGNLGPSLAGIGRRLSAGQLRLRLVDSSRLNPTTIMPSYFHVAGLRQVAQPYRNQPILTAQQIEDIVAYLQMLK